MENEKWIDSQKEAIKLLNTKNKTVLEDLKTVLASLQHVMVVPVGIHDTLDKKLKILVDDRIGSIADPVELLTEYFTRNDSVARLYARLLVHPANRSLLTTTGGDRRLTAWLDDRSTTTGRRPLALAVTKLSSIMLNNTSTAVVSLSQRLLTSPVSSDEDDETDEALLDMLTVADEMYDLTKALAYMTVVNDVNHRIQKVKVHRVTTMDIARLIAVADPTFVDPAKCPLRFLWAMVALPATTSFDATTKALASKRLADGDDPGLLKNDKLIQQDSTTKQQVSDVVQARLHALHLDKSFRERLHHDLRHNTEYPVMVSQLDHLVHDKNLDAAVLKAWKDLVCSAANVRKLVETLRLLHRDDTWMCRERVALLYLMQHPAVQQVFNLVNDTLAAEWLGALRLKLKECKAATENIRDTPTEADKQAFDEHFGTLMAYIGRHPNSNRQDLWETYVQPAVEQARKSEDETTSTAVDEALMQFRQSAIMHAPDVTKLNDKTKMTIDDVLQDDVFTYRAFMPHAKEFGRLVVSHLDHLEKALCALGKVISGGGDQNVFDDDLKKIRDAQTVQMTEIEQDPVVYPPTVDVHHDYSRLSTGVLKYLGQQVKRIETGLADHMWILEKVSPGGDGSSTLGRTFIANIQSMQLRNADGCIEDLKRLVKIFTGETNLDVAATGATATNGQRRPEGEALWTPPENLKEYHDSITAILGIDTTDARYDRILSLLERVVNTVTVVRRGLVPLAYEIMARRFAWVQKHANTNTRPRQYEYWNKCYIFPRASPLPLEPPKSHDTLALVTGPVNTFLVDTFKDRSDPRYSDLRYSRVLSGALKSSILMLQLTNDTIKRFIPRLAVKSDWVGQTPAEYKLENSCTGRAFTV